MAEFSGKSCLVTGGASGIGAATALLLAERGAHITIVDCSEQKAKQVVEAVSQFDSDASYFIADVSIAEQAEKAVAYAVEKRGSLDIISNNAGIQRYGTVETTSLPDWSQVLGVNLNSIFYICKYAIPFLKLTRGTIVNMTSVQAFATQENVAAYTTSKHAIIGLTRSMAIDFAHYGVRVNCVAPGTVNTPMLEWAASLDRSSP